MSGTYSKQTFALGTTPFTPGTFQPMEDKIADLDKAAGARTLGTLDADTVNGLTIGAVTAWTPGLTFGGGSTGITYNTQTGRYIRIGNLIQFTAYIILTSKGTSTGAAVITGLPVAAIAGIYPVIRAHMSTITYVGTPHGYVVASTQTISIRQISEAGTDSSLTDANFANTSTISISGEYYV